MANINIYGKLYNNTTDEIIAGAEQLWDDTQSEMQDILNARFVAGLDDIEGMIGQPNGIASLDENGTVPSSQLPSYVDDVLEFDSVSSFPAQGETGKIYVSLDTNLTYRWSGSTYVEISQSLALGETSSTAYPGDKGAATTATVDSLPSPIVSSYTKAISATAGVSTVTITVTDTVTRSTESNGTYTSGSTTVSGNVSIPAATTSNAGVMTTTDKDKLDNIGSITNETIDSICV